MSELSKTTARECRELMSALADGQVDAAARACAFWGSDPDAREAWHAYHLIGDVLRSEDLALASGRDAAFLAGIRARLADEPRVLAPQAAPEAALPPRAVRRWAAPAALAAGVVAAAGLLVASRVSAPDSGAGGSQDVASAAASAAGPARVSVAEGTASIGDPALQVLDGNLIRNARLDFYLRAHKGGGSGPLRGGTVGRFETVVLER